MFELTGLTVRSCTYLQSEAMVWTLVLGQVLLVAAYLGVAWMLLALSRATDDPRRRRLCVAFVAVFAGCGLTHVMALATMFLPWWRAEAAVLLATGCVSALALWLLSHYRRHVVEWVAEREGLETALRRKLSP